LRTDTDSTRRPVLSAVIRTTASASPTDAARCAPARSMPRKSSTENAESSSFAAT